MQDTLRQDGINGGFYAGMIWNLEGFTSDNKERELGTHLDIKLDSAGLLTAVAVKVVRQIRISEA